MFSEIGKSIYRKFSGNHKDPDTRRLDFLHDELKKSKFEEKEEKSDVLGWNMYAGKKSETVVSALFYVSKNRLDLAYVNMAENMKGYCGIVVTFFFIKVLSSLSRMKGFLDRKNLIGEVFVASDKPVAAGICYLKAFENVGFKITPRSMQILKDEYKRSVEKQLKKIPILYTLQFELRDTIIDYTKFHVFYRKKIGDYYYDLQISSKGIHNFSRRLRP